MILVTAQELLAVVMIITPWRRVWITVYLMPQSGIDQEQGKASLSHMQDWHWYDAQEVDQHHPQTQLQFPVSDPSVLFSHQQI